MKKIFEKSEEYLLYTLIILFPIFIIPISPNPFVVSRVAVASLFVALFLLIRIVKTIMVGKLELTLGKYDFPIAIMAIVYIASTILRTPNKMEAVLLPGTATLLVSGVLMYFAINQQTKKVKENLVKMLFVSSIIFATMSLFSATGLLAKIPQLPGYIRSTTFSPDGGYLTSALFLFTTLPLGLGLVLSEKKPLNKLLFGVGSLVISISLILFIFRMLPGKPSSPRLMTLSTAWYVSVDSLKESPLLGVGPGNYLTAFNRYRPLSYNATENWAIKFLSARSYYLTVLTEAGILGFAAIALMLSIFVRSARKDLRERKIVNWGFSGISNLISLSLLLLIFLVFPSSPLLILTMFVLLSLNTVGKSTTLNLTTSTSANELQDKAVSRFPAILVTAPVLVFVVLFFIQGSRIVLAEYTFSKAIAALANNDSQATYQNMISAISRNNQVDRYHNTLSQIDLLLANAISQKPDITDQDRADIANLVQQAIQESKSAVALNPLRAGNWFNLGVTYQSIMPFAEGSDAFAIQSLSQAIALDPLNPNIRVSLGGIYYTLKNYETAIRVLELAVRAKPDFANSRYNLAFAYKDAGKLDAAVAEMTRVLSLVDRDSPDYETAKTVLENFQSAQQAAKPIEGESLIPPQEVEPVIEPPIELPENAEPPEAPISPTLTPTPTKVGDEIGNEEQPTISPTPTFAP